MNEGAAAAEAERTESTARDGEVPAWHTLTVDETAQRLRVDPRRGLESGEAARRLARDGPNRIRAGRATPWWRILLAQFRSLIVILLLVATAVALALGDLFEASAILVVIAVNTLIGFVTELRAQQAISALEKQTVPTAVVIRDGRERKVAAEELVSGDLVVLEAGSRVPADGRLVDAAELQTQEASLTGESLPVTKQDEPLAQPDAALAERSNMVYLGTVVVAGRARMLVSATGMSTEVGRIGSLLEESLSQVTPMERRLDELGRVLVWLVGGLALVIVLSGLLRGFELLYMLEVGIALAIAAVPEGLPAVTTMTLAIGVQRMARAKAIVRRLPAVETLGSTTVICSDKTGTLTRNEMTVNRLLLGDRRVEVSGAGYDAEGGFEAGDNPVEPAEDERLLLSLRIGALCNDAALSTEGGRTTVIGDPTEGALLVAARKAGLSRKELERDYPRTDEVPFRSETQRMVTVHEQATGRRLAFSKGSPAAILERSNAILADSGAIEALDEGGRQAILELNREQAAQALRVLALAYKELPANYQERDLADGFVFVGLVCMLDPIREEVPAAIERCHRAGIRTVMITGDQALTASAIAARLGIDRAPDGSRLSTVHARELEGLDAQEMARVAGRAAVFARVSPEHKLRIVEAQQSRHEVVAMTGDGVNDAPALRRADIGIAMGIKGTDVAKEAAAMILGDDNFATIVRAVEQGRIIFANILRFIQYLFSCNLSEVLTVFVAIVIGWPLPLVALQILWLNIITDVFPAMALALEPSSSRIMEQAPRDPRTRLLNPRFGWRIVWQALLLTAVTLGGFGVGMSWYGTGEGLPHAVTISFMTLALAQVFHAFSVRSNTEPLVSGQLFRNGWLWGAVLLCLLLQLAAVYLPILQRALSTVPLGLRDWGLVLSLALAPVLVITLLKRARGTV